jgi:hypothetical protein
MINRNKLEHILEYARQQRHIGQSCKVPPEDMVEIMERLLNAGNSPVVPDDVSIFEAAIEECKTCDSIDEHAWNHGVLAVIAKYESCRAAMLAAAPQSPGSDPATVPGKWIPVSEQMPDREVDVQVYCPDKRSRWLPTLSVMAGWLFQVRNVENWRRYLLPAHPLDAAASRAAGGEVMEWYFSIGLFVDFGSNNKGR